MIEKLDELLEQFAKWAVVICVLLMLALSVLSIVLRWFEYSLMWVDPLVRHLVFISAFLGGSLATGASQHIKIDLVGRILEKSDMRKTQMLVSILALVSTLVACIILVVGSFDLMIIEFEYGKKEFLGIHSGFLVGIIPVGMSFIGLRVLTQLGLKLKGK
jgi:TRAP-type C4-dicarboxylate transport system permease small subunit